jgi:hypothetical protein
VKRRRVRAVVTCMVLREMPEFNLQRTKGTTLPCVKKRKVCEESSTYSINIIPEVQ